MTTQPYNPNIHRLKMIEIFEEMYDAIADLSQRYDDLHGSAMDLFSLYDHSAGTAETIAATWSELTEISQELQRKSRALGGLFAKSQVLLRCPIEDTGTLDQAKRN